MALVVSPEHQEEPVIISVIITVLSAAGLEVKGKILKREPNAGVRITVGRQQHRQTSIVKSISPFWNESFPLIGVDVSSSVLFEVYDDYVVKKSLGEIKCTVKELLEKQNDEVRFQLKCGSLTICVQEETEIVAAQLALAAVDATQEQISPSDLLPPVSESGLTVSESIADLVESLHILVSIADDFSKIHPYVHAAWRIVSSVYSVVKAQLDRDSKILSLVSTMKTLYSFVFPLRSLRKELLQPLEDVIKEILKQTIECVVFIQAYSKHSFAAKAIRAPWTSVDDAVQDFCNAFGNLAEALDTGIAVQTTIVSLRIDTRIQESILRERLNPVITDVHRRESCHPKTRLDIIKSITDWAFNAAGDKSNVFWLYGRAGSGKSAVSTSIASLFLEQKRLGAFISFDRRAKEENNDPLRVVPTLAYLLSLFDQDIHERVMNASDANKNAQAMQLDVQFRELFTRPVELSAGSLQGPVVIVIDALDECGSDQPRSPYCRSRFLLQFAKAMEALPPAIRVVVTSRPEPSISGALKNISSIHIEELEVSPESKDIPVYIQQRMDNILISKNHNIPDDWPHPLQISKLVELAEGLFIWAATACDMIASYRPTKTLNGLVGGKSKIPLNDLYSKILESSYERVSPNPAFEEDYQPILGLILAAKIPISPEAIDHFLQEEQVESYELISQLGSVLHYQGKGDPVHVLHLSFREYLTDISMIHPRWYISIDYHNQRLAGRCIDILASTFGTKFRHLTLDEPRKIQGLDEVVSYACSYWISHVCEMSICPVGFDKRLLEWLRGHLLHWLEALSMLEKSRTASGLLEQLLVWTKHNIPGDDYLHDFLYDASRFARFFSDTIAQHPALVYLSALPFAPLDSKIYKTFHNNTLPTVKGGYQQWWSPSLRVLKRLDTTILSLAFSPDGSKILSGGHRINNLGGQGSPGLRVWDVMAGTETVPFRTTDGPSCVAFAPDGSEVWSASEKGTILTLDAATGEVRSELCWEQWNSPSIEVAPKDMQSSYEPPVVDAAVLRGMDHMNLAVNIKHETPSEAKESNTDAGVLHGLNHIYSAVKPPHEKSKSLDDTSLRPATISSKIRPGDFIRAAFSSDGSVVVFGTKDESLYVVDRDKGRERYVIEPPTPFRNNSYGLYRRFRSIDFALDNQTFAVGSRDGTIHILKTETGVEMMKLTGHSAEVTVLKYTNDTLISSAADDSIRTWNTLTGEAVCVVRVEAIGGFQPLAFSFDGRKVASTSLDGTIHIWETESGKELGPVLQEHFNPVSAIAFSYGDMGSRLVSGSFINPIHIWDIADFARTHSSTIQRHVRTPKNVLFSDDGFGIRSWREDETKFWDTFSGKELTMQPYIKSANFVPMGSSVRSNDNAILLLDSEGEEWKPAEVYSASSLSPTQEISLEYSAEGVFTRDGETVWRLPLELRPRCMAIRNQYVACGLWNCRVVVIHLPFV